MSWRPWILDHWRLKVLSAVLALVLFGAVAFAQNPITFRTVAVRIDQYQISNPALVLVNYPTHVDVQLSGLANAVDPVSPDDVRAVMDMSAVTPPPADAKSPARVKVFVNAQVAAPGVTLQQSSIPIYVTVDRIATRAVPLDIVNNPAAGVSIDKTLVTNPASGTPVGVITVTGPQAMVNDLSAFVDLGAVQGSLYSPNEPVQFKDATQRTVKWPPLTIPPATLDIGTVNIQITAHQSFQQKAVSLVEYPTGQLPCGYEFAGITVNPATVTVTGAVADLASVSSIALKAIDVSSATADVSQREPVPVPPNVQVAPTSATVTISIRQAFSCTPASPTPTPSPSPTP